MKLVAALLVSAVALGQSPTVERTTTIGKMFPGKEGDELQTTFPRDREFHFRVRMPASSDPAGVLVFVSASDSGELPASWTAVLDEQRLTWVAGDGFGNSRPTAARMLVAMMGLRLARQLHATDEKRLYIAGISGGGRVASRSIALFPQLFTGAICIVGADYEESSDARLRELFKSRRLVFVTGSRDFNRYEIRAVRTKFQDAGVTGILFMDEPGFGHELAKPGQLADAIDFLDAR